ncbi:MAG: hypothetical protein DHS20C20_19710 [Ardenticatenaceae bacterium]|nr:MAG: hypothetical protein DHS20C20_19710 [Ardenticatenaceae bacterium]
MSEPSSSFSEYIHAKPQRPLGVWLLIIYGAIFAGIVPLGATLFILTSEEALAVLGNGIEYYFGIALSLAVLIFSFRTWQGNNRARIIFLILITLHYGLLALNN